MFFFFKQKTAYEIYECDWSSDVCSSDLGATQSSVVVLKRRNEVMLLVEDNGCGFKIDPVQQNSDSCLGLMGMKERAALLGGSCTVESILERGTIVRVRIPLEEA